MDIKQKPLTIYLMGIGGTAMGAFAGLLKKCGHHVYGSDNAVYSPMKEKLAEWEIDYKTPYSAQNIAHQPDLVIVGNVIRKDNPEAVVMREKNIPHESFPSALNKFFLQKATSIVASGTHGKTTCSALLAHSLLSADQHPGFLIGGIPRNVGESFRAPKELTGPFVIEGDEYDTAYFDKRPKFIHYNPSILLITALEYDHADIYTDLEAIIDAFASLLKTLGPEKTVIYNNNYPTIKKAIERSQTTAKCIAYENNGHYQAAQVSFDEKGISFEVHHQGTTSPRLAIPLYGHHNLSNALGCYAVLKEYGLSDKKIQDAFASFLGVKRRMEEIGHYDSIVAIDDFAHHPTAVYETIRAARQKYPTKKIWAIFEPRSATSCMKIFEEAYQNAFLLSDYALLAPVGRDLEPDKKIDTAKIAAHIRENAQNALACQTYEELEEQIRNCPPNTVLLFMSNGDFRGLLKRIDRLLSR